MPPHRAQARCVVKDLKPETPETPNTNPTGRPTINHKPTTPRQVDVKWSDGSVYAAMIRVDNFAETQTAFPAKSCVALFA